MAITQIRGSTQIMDESVTIEKLDPSLQALITRVQKRADFLAIEGQTELVNAEFDTGIPLEVYLNGVLQNPSEYIVTTGLVTLNVPMTVQDQATVFYGDFADGLANLITGDGSIKRIVSITQAEYDALSPPDEFTFYVVKD